MCGVIGYTGHRDCAELLIDGLSSLEYRGYDSAGIAVFAENEVEIVKACGRLDNLREKLLEVGAPSGCCGIGHTRWATHGCPSDLNSHPHSGGRVTLVHNGIIENYAKLRKALEAKGRVFLSETDTEIAANLIDYYYQGDPLEALREAISRIRGSYAFGVIFSDRPGEIYAVRRDSPLIAARANGESFIASDIPAILKYTKSYYLMDENEIAVLTKDGISFFTQDGDLVEKPLMEASWDVSAAEKGGYSHFMLKEIYEQPRALRDTLSSRISDGKVVLEGLGEGYFKGVPRVRIVACGTAMHAGLVGKHVIEHLAGIPVTVDIASEFRYADYLLDKEELVIIISQSGETADTLAALRLAKSHGNRVLAAVNVVGSSIAREADHVIYTHAGPEISVASTKAYSVQLAAMYLIAVQLASENDKLSSNEIAELCTQLLALPKAVEETFTCQKECQRLASVYQNAHSLFYIGRGLDNFASMEGSLKLKEISYVHSESYAAGELKHGTISLIEENTPVVAILTQKKLMEKTASNVKEVKARGARVLAICRQDAEVDSADDIIRLPEISDLFAPSLAVIPLQLFAFYMALLRGLDVDKPRNLAKSVTVE
ncbi:MAG: glutamine--fructose-6-phosphate transaminase (isomerizing) [Clostridia bacterium]|nr:glutamine--fructose-6-phosphate transaminase (isomerizing) [Clostridia bacterium]